MNKRRGGTGDTTKRNKMLMLAYICAAPGMCAMPETSENGVGFH